MSAENGVRNVIVFGETGAGKSSVINMLEGGMQAPVSMNLVGMTFASARYLKTIRGSTFTMFDTAGLNETIHGSVPPSRAIEQLYKLVHELRDDGISLLVYVMRAPRLKSTMKKNYEIFYDIFCQRSVPIVIIVTGLEVVGDVEKWWANNEQVLRNNEMSFHGHACITATQGRELQSGEHVYDDEYRTSKEDLKKLIYQFRDTTPWTVPSKTWIEDMVIRVHIILADLLGLDSKAAARDLRFALQAYGGLSRKEAASRAKSLEKTIIKQPETRNRLELCSFYSQIC